MCKQLWKKQKHFGELKSEIKVLMEADARTFFLRKSTTIFASIYSSISIELKEFSEDFQHELSLHVHKNNDLIEFESSFEVNDKKIV